MFKILNLILVSALILIASIACSSATEHTHDGRYLTTADFDYQVQKYNELLEYTKGLEQRVVNLESTSTSVPNSNLDKKVKSMNESLMWMSQDLKNVCSLRGSMGSYVFRCMGGY
tara:strand:+ start:158 stop:502 length:345 start_codon:yes stop_codon:yes gene_type:complete